MELEKLRADIDAVDATIIDSLAKRQALIIKVAEYKKAHGMAVVQPDRFAALLADKIKAGQAKGLSEAMIIAIWTAIHDASVQAQKEQL
jgi:chorismate mutase